MRLSVVGMRESSKEPLPSDSFPVELHSLVSTPTAMRRFAPIVPLLLASSGLHAQRAAKVFTHADTLRGSNGPGRDWWDAEFYDLHVAVSPKDSSVRGHNVITYRVLKPANEMQIDLQ